MPEGDTVVVRVRVARVPVRGGPRATRVIAPPVEGQERGPGRGAEGTGPGPDPGRTGSYDRTVVRRTMGDVSYSGSGGVGGVGDCTCLVPTIVDFGETSGPRIDRIPQTRPPWWRRQYRELKKLLFSTPSYVSNRSLWTISERKDTQTAPHAF